MTFIKRFLNDESRATTIEYALMAAGIGLAVAAGINAFGSNLNTWYSDPASTIGGLSTSIESSSTGG
jgi:pilus assembly protein Flp/PilA